MLKRRGEEKISIKVLFYPTVAEPAMHPSCHFHLSFLAFLAGFATLSTQVERVLNYILTIQYL